PSPLTRFPSSHPSSGATTPLPHAEAVQFTSQPSPFTALPSSHASPTVGTPLPQPVGVQLLSQSSPSTRLPSSQRSPTSSLPLPHSRNSLSPQPATALEISAHSASSFTADFPMRRLLVPAFSRVPAIGAPPQLPPLIGRSDRRDASSVSCHTGRT